jgi:hypothetical protein
MSLRSVGYYWLTSGIVGSGMVNSVLWEVCHVTDNPTVGLTKWLFATEFVVSLLGESQFGSTSGDAFL